MGLEEYEEVDWGEEGEGIKREEQEEKKSLATLDNDAWRNKSNLVLTDRPLDLAFILFSSSFFPSGSFDAMTAVV